LFKCANLLEAEFTALHGALPADYPSSTDPNSRPKAIWAAVHGLEEKRAALGNTRARGAVAHERGGRSPRACLLAPYPLPRCDGTSGGLRKVCIQFSRREALIADAVLQLPNAQRGIHQSFCSGNVIASPNIEVADSSHKCVLRGAGGVFS
jgi:hypothetical protein